MLLNISLHKNYTLHSSTYQLKLPLNIETIIPADDSVRLLSQFVAGMDLTDLYSTYQRVRENSVSPRTLLKIVLYSEGANAPYHATFARFRSIHFVPCSKQILAEMTNKLYDFGEISREAIFIDGKKIEASANKYTFVWKKAVTKNQAKLLMKLADFIAECEQLYDIKICYSKTIQMRHIKRLRKNLYALKESENPVFVHGIGKR